MAACIGLSIAVSTLFRYRENSLLFLLWTSIPLLMLSGVSYPREAFPTGFPVRTAIPQQPRRQRAFIRIQTMGPRSRRSSPKSRRWSSWLSSAPTWSSAAGRLRVQRSGKVKHLSSIEKPRLAGGVFSQHVISDRGTHPEEDRPHRDLPRAGSAGPCRRSP